MPSLISTLVLTLLLGIGLVFFLRAASKDRTT
ncbi:MAG: cofactor assembly of complex C subunit B, partial [Cyanobacteriota bacterium]